MVRSLIVGLLLSAAASLPAAAQSRFYDPSPAEIEGAPGTIIRQETLSGAPLGAAAYRVLYRSTGLDGRPIPVSGVVIVPATPAPPGGRPVVAWAHPTTGVVPRCAPSLAIFLFQQIQGLREMVERGYVVAATDYPGLGTPETHPYLVGVSEARAVLDSVRAARAIQGSKAGGRFVVWGHSQGGQAALFTGLEAKQYAPDLDLLGVAAAAPATELATLMNDDMDTSGGKNLTAMTQWSWARVFDAPIDKVVAPDAMPVIDRLAEECIESIGDLWERQRTEKPLEKSFLSVPNLAGLEPWRSLMGENTPGTLPPGIPLFVAQGTTDQIVRPAVTRDYVGRLCKAGSKVSTLVLPNVGHGFIARDAAGAAVAWMADRFAGKPAPDGC
jgi:acetyl esterase/lipase